jgi:hypothetical protein
MQTSFAARRRRHLARRMLGLALVGGLVLALSAPGDAQATCLSSVPNTAGFADDPADAGVAPEITGVTATLNGACGISVNPAFSTPALDLGDGVAIALNVDGNPATGDPYADGADTEVITVGEDGPDLVPELFRWNGFDWVDTGTPLHFVGLAGFSSTLDQIGVPAPGTIGIEVASLSIDEFGNLLGVDFAPEVGAFPFAVSFSSPPPPPPPPSAPPPAPTPPSPSPPASAEKVSGCVVPHVKRLRVSRAKKKLRRAGCKYRIKGHGKKVKSTSPRAGTRTHHTVIVKTNKKRRKRHRKSRGSATVAHAYERIEQAFAAGSSSR